MSRIEIELSERGGVLRRAGMGVRHVLQQPSAIHDRRHRSL